MGDLTYKDSDWAMLGGRVIDRSHKAFRRLEKPTPQEIAKAKQLLSVERHKPKVVKGHNGRPKKHPDLLRAALLREKGFTWERVAKVLGVHRNTLFRARKEINGLQES